MTETIPCLILACGNVLREDDGFGPWLAAWAKERFRYDPRLCVLARHQWTPELAEDIAAANAVIFIDCATNSDPGLVQMKLIESSDERKDFATHQLDARQLLLLANQLYSRQPRQALLLSVGAGSLELREGFSAPVLAALPEACKLLERSILESLSAA